MAMGIKPDGTVAYVTDAGLDQVHRIDVAQKKVVGSLPIGRYPVQALLHPTRPLLYIPCMQSGDVYVVDIDRWRVDRVISVGKGAQGIAFTADGRYAYVTLAPDESKGAVALLDTETDRIRATIPVEDRPGGIAVLFGKNQGW